MGHHTTPSADLPEGTTVLHREPAERSVELALELAHLGASDRLVRAVGGDEAVEVLYDNGNGAVKGA